MTTWQRPFPYMEAVSRNLGWLSEAEQLALKPKKVAIAGLGGVGGIHLLTLARLGVGRFHVADLDTFEIANFNRQVGARIDTVGRPKTDVLVADAEAINPSCEIQVFGEGVTDANLDEFLHDVDLFIDGFDFFVIEQRAATFARCRELGIPAITAAPLGMGTAYIVFTADGMSFEDYFRLADLGVYEKYANFLVGLAPKGLHRAALVDPSRLNLAEERGPSTIMGCNLAAGVTGAEAVKLLLNRGPIRPAPWFTQFDAYTGRFTRGKLRWGNAGPLQRLKLAAVHRTVRQAAQRQNATPLPRAPRDPMEAILDLARWAPSGDNVQPWRFEVLNDTDVEVHVRIEEDANVYEFDRARPTWISVGCLIETLRIAASTHGRALTWAVSAMGIRVRLVPDASVCEDSRFPYITQRSVDRRAYRTTPLTAQSKARLEQAIGPDHRVVWFESFASRWQMARLSAAATDIRLRLPETYPVHRDMLDWTRDHSPTGIPARATGLDALTRRVMRWALQDWKRVRAMNKLPGSLFPMQAQMDLLPGLACAAYFLIEPQSTTVSEGSRETAVNLGIAFQRFWLETSRLGLAMQPNFAPQCFAHHGPHLPTVDSRVARSKGAGIRNLFQESTGRSPEMYLAIGRLGRARGVSPARSTRRDLHDLMIERRGTATPVHAMDTAANRASETITPTP